MVTLVFCDFFILFYFPVVNELLKGLIVFWEVLISLAWLDSFLQRHLSWTCLWLSVIFHSKDFPFHVTVHIWRRNIIFPFAVWGWWNCALSKRFWAQSPDALYNLKMTTSSQSITIVSSSFSSYFSNPLQSGICSASRLCGFSPVKSKCEIGVVVKVDIR